MHPKTITVGELRTRLLQQLNALNDNDLVMFGGGALSLYRPKDRGTHEGRKLMDVEFNEIFKVTHDPDLMD